MRKTMAVLGGDMRQVYLADLLLEDGWDVVTWGLEKGYGPNSVELGRAVEQEILILPLPVCRGKQLHLPLSETQLAGDRLWSRIPYQKLLLGGLAGELKGRLMKDYGLTLVDYYQREELQVANAAATAEGAIGRAMEETRHTLLGRDCLVIGFGRIGKLLARRLHGLGARVTVTARRYDDLAWAGALGYRSLRTGDMAGRLGGFSVIYNTVPARVLEGKLLAETDQDCVLLELASAPGGIDPEAARLLERKLIQVPGLPGIVAPQTVAEALRDTIYHILEERGETI